MAISQETRLSVIDSLLRGQSYADIAESEEVSRGTITKIADEFKSGDYPEIAETAERYDALRELATTLNDQDATVTQALAGAATLQQLRDLDMDLEGLREQLQAWEQLHDRLDEPDVTPSEYLDAALELHQLEASSGKSFDDLREHHDRLEEEIADLETERDELAAECDAIADDLEALEERHDIATDIDTLEATIAEAREREAQAEAAREAAIEQAEATESDLEAYRTFRNRAKEYGFSAADGMDRILELLGTHGADDTEQLVAIHDGLDEIGVPAEQAIEVVEQCLQIADHGFTPDTAEAAAKALSRRDEGLEASLDRLVDLLDQHATVADAVHELEQREQALEASVASLETKIDAKEAEFDEAKAQAETERRTVEELRETRSDLNDALEQLQASRDDLREEVERLEEKLDALGRERREINAFRQFLVDQRITPELGDALTQLRWSNQGDTPHPEPVEDLSERLVKDWLVERLLEFTDGEDAISMRKHRRLKRDLEDQIAALERERDELTAQLEREQNRRETAETQVEELESALEREREARETEQSIRELENELSNLEHERQATQSVLAFAADGDIRESLIEELLRIKRGEASHLDSFVDRKEEAVRETLIEAFNELVPEDEAVISRVECEERIEAVRSELEATIEDKEERIATLEAHLLDRVEGIEEVLELQNVETIASQFDELRESFAEDLREKTAQIEELQTRNSALEARLGRFDELLPIVDGKELTQDELEAQIQKVFESEIEKRVPKQDTGVGVGAAGLRGFPRVGSEESHSVNHDSKTRK